MAGMATAVRSPLAGSGVATGPGCVTAAVEQALAALGAARPSVVLAFPTPTPEPASADGLDQTLPAAPLVGMTGTAVLGVDGPYEQESCSVLGLGGPLPAAGRVRADRAPRTP